MPQIKTADRVIVRVVATESGDWQVVSVPEQFQGITEKFFAADDLVHGVVLFDTDDDWEVYDGDEASDFLRILNTDGTVVLARPAKPFDSSNNGNRVDAGTGTHTLALTLGAASAARMFRETNPTWKALPAGDATPNMAGYRLFKTAGTTNIIRFDDMERGQLFFVRRGTDDITIESSSDILIAGDVDITLTVANPFAVFIEDAGVAAHVFSATSVSASDVPHTNTNGVYPSDLLQDALDYIESFIGNKPGSIDPSTGAVDATGLNDVTLTAGGVIGTLTLDPDVLTRINWDGINEAVIESVALDTPDSTDTVLNAVKTYVFVKNIGGHNTLVGPGMRTIAASDVVHENTGGVYPSSSMQDALDQLESVIGHKPGSDDISDGIVDGTDLNDVTLSGGGDINTLTLDPGVLTKITWDGTNEAIIKPDVLLTPDGARTTLGLGNRYVFAKNIGGTNTVVGPGSAQVAPVVNVFPTVSPTDASETDLNNFLSSLPEGSIADLGGQTIGIEGSIAPTVPNTTIRNGTIMILPTAPDGVRALKPEGSIGASVPLLNDGGREDAFFEVADNSPYHKGQIVRVSADNLFGSSSSGGVVVSELAVVRGLDGSQRVLIYRGLSDNYRTSNNAKIEPLTTLDNIRFENIRVVGDGTARLNLGFEFLYTRGGVVEGCFGENVYARFCQFNCSHSFRAENNECEVDGGTSMYGFSVSNGSRSGEILNNKIYRSRHGFATAGGFVNRDVVVKGNSVYGATNAGLDAHGSSDRISYIENDVHVEGSDGTNDGLVFQGKNLIAVGNTFRGRLRAGIYHQSRSYDTEGSRDATSRICDNEFYCQTMTSEGIRVEVDSHTVDGSPPNRMTGVIISGNRINSARMEGSGISVRAHGNDIRDVSIYGNTVQKFGEVEGSHGIFLEARGGHNIQYASITGGTLRSDGDAGDSIRLDGETSVSIRWGAISGVMMRGGNRAVNSINENDSDYFVSGCSVDGITDSGNEFSLSSRSTVGDNNIG